MYLGCYPKVKCMHYAIEIMSENINCSVILSNTAFLPHPSFICNSNINPFLNSTTETNHDMVDEQSVNNGLLVKGIVSL